MSVKNQLYFYVRLRTDISATTGKIPETFKLICLDLYYLVDTFSNGNLVKTDASDFFAASLSFLGSNHSVIDLINFISD